MPESIPETVTQEPGVYTGKCKSSSPRRRAPSGCFFQHICTLPGGEVSLLGGVTAHILPPRGEHKRWSCLPLADASQCLFF